ncbi:MAG: DNA alkylation repair protein [Anaerolineales bacterium]
MTAINPARLRIQSVELSEKYSDPDAFVLKLHDILDFYAVRVRKNKITRTPLLLHSHQVAPPVLRAIEAELKDPLNTQPSQGILLIDALWKEEWVETHTLAISLLGELPPINPDSIFKRIKSWLSDSKSDTIRILLPTRGLSRLVEEKPALVLEFFQELLNSPSKNNCQAVLFGIIPFAEGEDFENLPLLYKFLDWILLVDEKGLIKETLEVLKILIQRSEQESLYFLKKQLSTASKPRILRVIRQILPSFSTENQAILREVLNRYS